MVEKGKFEESGEKTKDTLESGFAQEGVSGPGGAGKKN
jgi:hypothetical protein